jgi:hypothetical protein
VILSRPIAVLTAAILLPAGAFAQDAQPASTLVELQRQFLGCIEAHPVGPAGSVVTFAYMLKRDGSVFGKPRITFYHLEGEAEAKRQFLEEAERALDACTPLKVTPALGAAIAGRMFWVRIGAPKPTKGA